MTNRWKGFFILFDKNFIWGLSNPGKVQLRNTKLNKKAGIRYKATKSWEKAEITRHLLSLQRATMLIMGIFLSYSFSSATQSYWVQLQWTSFLSCKKRNSENLSISAPMLSKRQKHTSWKALQKHCAPLHSPHLRLGESASQYLSLLILNSNLIM